MTRRSIRIGLVFGYGLDDDRDILRGIKAFAEARPHRVFTPIEPEPRAGRAMRPLHHTGTIAHVFHRGLAEALIDGAQAGRQRLRRASRAAIPAGRARSRGGRPDGRGVPVGSGLSPFHPPH